MYDTGRFRSGVLQRIAIGEFGRLRFGTRYAKAWPVRIIYGKKRHRHPDCRLKKLPPAVPRRFAIRVPASLIRTSNSRCRGVCGSDMNSSLDIA